MLARLTSLALLGLLACDTPQPDPRGTFGQPFRVELDFSDLADQLLQVRTGGGFGVRLEQINPPSDIGTVTSITVGDDQTLTVIPRSGDPIAFVDKPVSGSFYHDGHLLVVRAGPESSLVLHHFFEPVRWFTAPRAVKPERKN